MRPSSNLKMILLAFLIILQVLYILAVLIIARPSFSIFPWYINYGIIASLTLIVVLAILLVMPWKKSAEGEEEVYKELIRLPKEFLFIADFHKNRKGNVDFVVIGPTGIYTVESKNTIKGQVTVESDHLRINGSLFKDIDPLKQSSSEAEQIREYLKESLGLSLPVTPVLVFTNPGVEMTCNREKQNGVYIVTLNCLNSLITDMPASADLVPDLCKKIKEDMNKYSSDIV